MYLTFFLDHRYFRCNSLITWLVFNTAKLLFYNSTPCSYVRKRNRTLGCSNVMFEIHRNFSHITEYSCLDENVARTGRVEQIVLSVEGRRMSNKACADRGQPPTAPPAGHPSIQPTEWRTSSSKSLDELRVHIPRGGGAQRMLPYISMTYIVMTFISMTLKPLKQTLFMLSLFSIQRPLWTSVKPIKSGSPCCLLIQLLAGMPITGPWSPLNSESIHISLEDEEIQ